MDNQITIERADAGDLTAEELNAVILQVWRETLADANTRADIADQLRIAPEALDPNKPLFHAQISRSGLSGGEIAIFLAGVVGQVVLERIIDRSLTELQDAAREIWKKHLRRKINKPGENNIGAAKVEEE